MIDVIYYDVSIIMNLKEFHYLDAIDTYKHFGKAAQACHVSQPTLSAQVKKYEAYLGVMLFDRHTKDVVTTDVGRKIIDCARRIISEESRIKEIAQSYHDPFKGECRLGCFPTLAPYFFPKLIPLIKKNFPDLSILLIEEKTDTLLEQLKVGEIDIAFLALPLEIEDMTSYELFDDEFLLAVPTAHQFYRRKKVNTKDLQSERLLLLEEGHCLRQQALNLCSIHEWHSEVNYRASSLETLRQMVIAGSGLTLIPKIAITDNFVGIHYIPFSKPAPSRKIAMITRSNYSRKILAEELQQLIKDYTQLQKSE